MCSKKCLWLHPCACLYKGIWIFALGNEYFPPHVDLLVESLEGWMCIVVFLLWNTVVFLLPTCEVYMSYKYTLLKYVTSSTWVSVYYVTFSFLYSASLLISILSFPLLLLFFLPPLALPSPLSFHFLFLASLTMLSPFSSISSSSFSYLPLYKLYSDLVASKETVNLFFIPFVTASCRLHCLQGANSA